MGSRFKKSIVSENVRKSLHGWQRKVKARHGGPPFTHLTATTSTTSLDSVLDEIEIVDAVPSTSGEGSSAICEDTSMVQQNQIYEISPSDEKLKVPFCEGPQDSYDDSSDEHSGDIDVNDSSCIVPLA